MKDKTNENISVTDRISFYSFYFFYRINHLSCSHPVKMNILAFC